MKILGGERGRCWPGILMLGALFATSAGASGLVAELSHSFESGDFGATATTEITTTSLKLSYFGEVWSAALKLPYLRVSGVETIIPGTRGNVRGHGAGADTTTAMANTVTRAGIGDAQLSLSRAWLPQHDTDLLVEWTLRATLATADESRLLGSGENDYALEVYVDKPFGNWLPRLVLGYQLTGDTPQVDYNDTGFVSVGAAYRLSAQSSLGFSYDTEQAALDGAGDFRVVAVDYSSRLTRQARIGLGLQAGLNDSSPERALNLSLSLSF